MGYAHLPGLSIRWILPKSYAAVVPRSMSKTAVRSYFRHQAGLLPMP